jgi:multidrug resistance efflux pump
MSGPDVIVAGMVLSVPILGIISKSEIGQAIADAIRHNSGATKGAAARRELEQMRGDMDQLRAELDDVHAQLLEAHERLDFAERLLARPEESNTNKPSVNA